MGLTAEDLRPKNFKITIKGVELECKPLKLSHTLVIGSVGDIFSNIKDADIDTIRKAERELAEILPEIIPDLSGIELDGETMMDIITLVMESTTPSDAKYLEQNGVKKDVDPKAEKVEKVG